MVISFIPFSVGVVDTIKQQRDTTSYYVEAGSHGTMRETSPPRYGQQINGMTIGLDSRSRFEFRRNDLRKAVANSVDFPLLLRQRMFIGVDNSHDIFQFGLEVEDARVAFSQYPLTNRDVNQTELIQGYIGLRFENKGRPVTVRLGRMAFEFLDRRLIAMNQWRNTTNNFAGFHAAWGEDRNDWQVDLMVLRPIVRVMDSFDEADYHRLFFAVIGHWRRWSNRLTIEPFIMSLRQDPHPSNDLIDRKVHSIGIRTYAWVGDTGLNYDLSGICQFGHDGSVVQRAFAYTAEIGYTIKTNTHRPRLSVFFGYASGDRDPNDHVNNRFERYFGSGSPWSPDDYIIMENIMSPKLKIEFQQQVGPMNVKVDGGYSGYWLASATDRMNNLLAGLSQNRDKFGKSSNFIGHGADIRLRFSPLSFVDATVGYSQFYNGTFVQSRQHDALLKSVRSTNFAFIEFSVNIPKLIGDRVN